MNPLFLSIKPYIRGEPDNEQFIVEVIYLFDAYLE